MSSATLGLGSDAARVIPALLDTVFHRNDCLRLLSVTTNVAPPCSALDSAALSLSRVPEYRTGDVVSSRPSPAASLSPTASPATTSAPDVDSARTMGRGFATPRTSRGDGHGASGGAARVDSSTMGMAEMLGVGGP